jgi:anti-sigma factor RsiW
MACTIATEQLDAYREQELEGGEAEQLRRHVDQCAECARRIAELARQSTLLKDALVRYSAPDTLRARIRSALEPANAATPVSPVSPVRPVTSRRRPEWMRLAAAVLVTAFVSGGGAYLAARQELAVRSTTDAVVAAHVRSLMPGHLTDVASTEHHNVKPWFNGRVDLSPGVPDLGALGFPLVGGRLDYIGGRPVAAVVYARRQHLINVFSWPDGSGRLTPTSTRTERGYHIIRWSAAGVETWAISDLNPAELRQFTVAFTAGR